jgi:ElaB/YqjD/DUF883 family membrane-anchored ribosome-binding protein
MTGTREPDQIRADIEAAREQLGDTVEALAQKTDVKAQTKRRLDETKASVVEKKDELLDGARQVSPEAAVSAASGATQKARENPLPLAVGGAFVVGFLAGRISTR